MLPVSARNAAARTPKPGDYAVTVLIIVLAVALLAMPVSLPALVDFVPYLQAL